MRFKVFKSSCNQVWKDCWISSGISNIAHTKIVLGHWSFEGGSIDSVLLYCIVLYCVACLARTGYCDGCSLLCMLVMCMKLCNWCMNCTVLMSVI